MRFERRQVLFIPIGAASIVAAVAASTHSQSELRWLLQPGVWPALTISVLAVALTAWLGRFAFLVARSSLTLCRLPRAERPPERLVSAMVRTGAARVRCIAGDVPIAFCAGTVRPEIVVSEGLAELLDDRELDAVLLHEHHHLRHHEPVIRAAAEAAAEVLFFFPIARWWSRRRTEEAELRADQAAVREVGPRPVAAALCALGSSVRSEAAFAGGADLRVAQLLGDPLPVRRPSAALAAASVIGLALTLLGVACIDAGVARVLGH